MIFSKTKSKRLPDAPQDAVVVGSGLSGLLASAMLLREGRRVLLLEKQGKLGGRYSPEERDGFLLGAGFRFGDAAEWRHCADRLGLSAPTLALTNGGALLHSTRGWIEPEDLPKWESYFAAPCREYPEQGYYGLVSRLVNFCESQSAFTAILEAPLTSLEIQEGRVAKATIGADEIIELQDCYWCSDYKDLLETLHGDGVPPAGPGRVSWLKKFVKTDPSPAVVLEFAHNQKFAEFTETLLLPFSAGEKEDRRYLVGALLGNRDPSLAPKGKELSSWILPLNETEWGDNHETMKKIRSARRLMEKAFPNFEKSIEFDRVLVLERSVTPLDRKKGEWHPLLPNLRQLADWASPSGATPESAISLILDHLI